MVSHATDGDLEAVVGEGYGDRLPRGERDRPGQAVFVPLHLFGQIAEQFSDRRLHLFFIDVGPARASSDRLLNVDSWMHSDMSAPSTTAGGSPGAANFPSPACNPATCNARSARAEMEHLREKFSLTEGAMVFVDVGLIGPLDRLGRLAVDTPIEPLFGMPRGNALGLALLFRHASRPSVRPSCGPCTTGCRKCAISVRR